MVIQAYFGEKVYTMKPFTQPIETHCFRMIKFPLYSEN